MKKLLFFIVLLSVPLFAAKRGYTDTGFIGHDNTEDRACSVQTTSATLVTCETLTIPDNSSYKVSAECSGIRSDNAEVASIDKCVLIKRISGTTSIEGSVITTFDQPGTSGWDTDISVSGDDIIVEAKSPSETVNWSCRIRLVKKL